MIYGNLHVDHIAPHSTVSMPISEVKAVVPGESYRGSGCMVFGLASSIMSMTLKVVPISELSDDPDVVTVFAEKEGEYIRFYALVKV